MLWLETAGGVVGEISLDPIGTFVTNLDTSDCAAAGIPLAWLDSPTNAVVRVADR